MLRVVFYARFHTGRGPSILHQHPKDLTPTPDEEPLFQWSEISSYIIPPYDLCNQALSICTGGHRVLGFPISLEDARYERNRFTFNVCFVLDSDADTRPWDQIVRKTASFFQRMEEEDGLLRVEEALDGLVWAGEEGYPATGVGNVYPLLEKIMEDLNRYGETCARVDDMHVLNLRLAFPRSPPPKVHAWEVPLLIRPLPDHELWTWDLALQRIHPYIDGVKHVQSIAELADVELKLVESTIQELVYHGRAMLLDIFHYQAIYACTSDIALFFTDAELLEECQRYITIVAPQEQEQDQSPASPSQAFPPASEIIINLYTALQFGTTLADFAQTHNPHQHNIDLRRLITYGTTKNFLRRIHKYALALSSPPPPPKLPHQDDQSPRKSKSLSPADAAKSLDRAWKQAVLSSGWATPPNHTPPASLVQSQRSADELRSEEDAVLRKYLDGSHCLDQMCVEMHWPESRVLERLKGGKFGEVVVFCR